MSQSWTLAAALAVLASIEFDHQAPSVAGQTGERVMTAQELPALPSGPPDQRIAYGGDPSQYGELRVPAGTAPHPVVVLIHGGCFKAAYASAQYFGAMADALRTEGIATWNIEYRRLDEPGSGWPGTYRDVGAAIDHLRTMAGPHHLDLGRVVVVGHSAGGHLAMWAASRPRLAATSDLYVAKPLPLRGVVDLSGPVDMAQNISGYEAVCGDIVITSLLGGTPSAVPERYAQASAIKQDPLGIPQVLLLGSADTTWPVPLVDDYIKVATAAGDPVRRIIVPGAGHFDIANPHSSRWPQLRDAIKALLTGKLPG